MRIEALGLKGVSERMPRWVLPGQPSVDAGLVAMVLGERRALLSSFCHGILSVKPEPFAGPGQMPNVFNPEAFRCVDITPSATKFSTPSVSLMRTGHSSGVVPQVT